MTRGAQEQWLPLLAKLREAMEAFGEASTKAPSDAGIAALHGVLAMLLGMAGTYVGAKPAGWSAMLYYWPPNETTGWSSHFAMTMVPAIPHRPDAVT